MFEAPEDLRQIGEYIVFNGNHRWKAAKETGIYLPCMLIENDDDMRRIEKRDEKLSTTVPYTYSDQKEEIWRIAKEYHLHPATERKQRQHRGFRKMKILTISPELIIPWEHKEFDKHLGYKAIDEKYMKRPLEERIANAAAALNELQSIGISKYMKKYADRYDDNGWACSACSCNGSSC